MQNVQTAGSSQSYLPPAAGPANYEYPEGMKVYGMVIDEKLDAPMIKLGLDVLSHRDADLLLFLCLAPHDIRERTDWEDIARHIRFGNNKEAKYEVRLVRSSQELLEASFNIHIIRLPTDYVFI